MSNDQHDIPSAGDSTPSKAAPSAIEINGHLGDPNTAVRGISPASLQQAIVDIRGEAVSDTPRFDRTGQTMPAGLPLEFRVVRAGAPVRRLRLTGNRYTIGSGEGCSIQLDDQSLRSMHAVLLRDAHRVLMRAYSVPLECNGNRVTERVLRVGDVIRMGSYRFELLSAPLGADDLSDSEIRMQRSIGRLQAAVENDPTDTHLRNRLTELSQQWHARHAECEIRETRCDHRESELHSRETELWSRAEKLQRREHFLVAQEAAAKEIQQTHAQTQQELQTLREREAEVVEELERKQSELLDAQEQLKHRQAELEKRQAEWQQREQEFSQRAAEAQHQLEQTQQQAQSANDAVGRMRADFAALNEQLTELRERHSQLQHREREEQAEHERLRSELETQREQLQTQRDDAVNAYGESEAQRTRLQEELDRVAAELQSTRAEIERVRNESKDCQQELNEKLRATNDELAKARQQAEASRKEAETAQHAAEQAQRHARAAEDQLQSAQQQTEAALRDAEGRRGQAEQAAQQSAESRQQALQAQQEAAEAQKELEAARREASTARQQVEAARQQVEAAQQESEAARQQADSIRAAAEQREAEAAERVEQLQRKLDDATAQIEETEQSASDEITRLREQCDQALAGRNDAETNAEQLRETIRQLQEDVARANQEAQKTRSEFEGAAASIKQLELLVDQTQGNQNQQHESWTQESQQLKQTIDELSDQLAAAHADLSQLRSVNEALTQQIAADGTDQDASSDVAAIDVESFGQLEQELESARQEIERLKTSHAETIESLNHQRHESETALRAEIEQLREEIAAAQQSAQQAAAQTVEQAAQQAAEPTSEQRTESIAPQWQATPGLQSAVETGQHAGQDETSGDRSGDNPVSAWQTELPAESTLEAEHSVWRMEGEQHVEQSGHLSSWDQSDDAESAEWHAVSDADDSADDAERESISWHDEPPEQAVSEAIEDIEHHVEQVIGDLPPEHDTDSPWDLETADSHVDEPVESELATHEPAEAAAAPNAWAAADESAQAELNADSSGDESSDDKRTQQWAGQLEGELATIDPVQQQSQGQQPWIAQQDLVDPQDLIERQELVEQQDLVEQQATDEANTVEASAEDWSASADEQTSTGSLAEMLIRDLENVDEDDQPSEGTEHAESTSWSGWTQDGSADVQDGSAGAADSESDLSGDGELQTAADDVIEVDPQHDDVPQCDLDQLDLAETALGRGNETVTASLDAANDDSIEAYMSRLLQRVQRPTQAAGQDDERQVKEIEEESPVDATEELGTEDRGDSSEAAQTVTEPPRENVPLVPRSQAPELKRNLSAMRDLANQSARNAVARSIRIQARDTQMKAVLKAAVAAGFATMALGAYLLVNWSPTIKIAMIGAFAVLAGVFGQEAYILMRDARRRLALADTAAKEDLEDDGEIAEELRRLTEDLDSDDLDSKE